MSIEHDDPQATQKHGAGRIPRRAFVAAAAAAALTAPALAQSSTTEKSTMSPELVHLNPDGMHKNPAFSQGIIIPANSRILIIGGQNAVNAKGEVVGKGDVAAQTRQALDNLETVLKAAGGTLDGLVRVGLALREDADLQAGFAAWMERAGKLKKPPTVTASFVSKLATPDYLVEIEATAVLP
jgi:enamine deaminase RidA (YjgF/YER057c/UK114 family)